MSYVERRRRTTRNTAARSIERSVVSQWTAGVASGTLADATPGNFIAYRRTMRPELLENEFTEQLAVHMVDFYNDLRNGERPRLALFTPPQHGKSTIVRDFIGWASGRTPQLKTIFASYSDELGQVTNRELQRMLSSPQYTNIFSHMHVGAPGWRMTSDVIEYPGFPGYFRNTTVRGSITGLGLDLGVIDDPHKGRQEAYSPQERDKVWHWFTSDFL